MKSNRSNQQTNLVAGTFMSLILTLLALALIPLNDLYALPQADKDFAEQIFDTMVQLPGNKPGNRLVHAKRIMCQEHLLLNGVVRLTNRCCEGDDTTNDYKEITNDHLFNQNRFQCDGLLWRENVSQVGPL
jgi:hypothetical protein